MTIQNQFSNQEQNLVAISFFSKKGLRFAIISNGEVINIISHNVFNSEGYAQIELTYNEELLQELMYNYHTKRNQELQTIELQKNLEIYKAPLKDEYAKVTSCPKDILKGIKEISNLGEGFTFFEGSIISQEYKRSGRYFNAYNDIFEGLFVKNPDNSYTLVSCATSTIISSSVVSSKKRNYNTFLTELTPKELASKLQKEYKTKATAQLQEENKKFNQAKIDFSIRFVENYK